MWGLIGQNETTPEPLTKKQLKEQESARTALLVEASFLSGLKEKDPTWIEVKENIFTILLELKEFRIAKLLACEMASSRLDDQVFLYNAACASSRDNDAKLAVKFIWLAIDAGFNNLEMIMADSDLILLRQDRFLRQIERKIGKLMVGKWSGSGQL